MAAAVDDFGGTRGCVSATSTWYSNGADWTAIPANPKLTKEELKAIAREEQREQSLDACLCLSWAHHIETPPSSDAPPRLLRRLPTQRRTATAVRNHRRA